MRTGITDPQKSLRFRFRRHRTVVKQHAFFDGHDLIALRQPVGSVIDTFKNDDAALQAHVFELAAGSHFVTALLASLFDRELV